MEFEIYLISETEPCVIGGVLDCITDQTFDDPSRGQF